MITQIIKPLILTALLSLLAFVLFPVFAQAASTEWKVIDGARFRLHAAPIKDENNHSTMPWGIAIEIELDEGWKTYWKNPGSSGVPPLFKWQTSKNISQEPVMQFPTPALYDDVNGKIIGYKHRVVFTSDVRAINEDQPINLDVTAQLGICREICIPVKVELALNNINQTSKAEAHQEALNIFNESHKKLPKEANEQLRITQITTIADKAGYLKITAKIPENAQNIHLLPVGAQGWYLFPAKLLNRDGIHAQFELDINDIPKGGNVFKTPIEYTLIADGTAVAITTTASE